MDGTSERAKRLSGTWFFFPLPDRLPLPDKFEVPRLRDQGDYDEDRARVREALLEQGADPMVTEHLARLDASILIHQLMREADPGEVAVRELAGWVSWSPTVGDLPELDDPSAGVQTCVEVFVPVSAFGVREDSIDAALEFAIDSVRELQQAYAASSGHPVRLVSRTTIPTLIPVVNGTAGGGKVEAEATFHHPAGSTDPTPSGEILSASQIEHILRVRSARASSMATAAFGDLRREAEVQLRRRDERRAAAITIGIAGEVFMATLHQWLLWEDGVSPETAAARFDATVPHTARVVSDLPALLGGTWRRGQGDIGRYLDDVVALRNRVAHRGYAPRRIEVENAVAAYDNAVEYAMARLTAYPRLKKYPRTAFVFCGREGLTSRGRLTKQVQSLLDDLSCGRERNWRYTFERWRAHLDRVLHPAPDAPGRNASGLRMLVLPEPGGEPRFVVWDTTTGHAAEITKTKAAALSGNALDDLNAAVEDIDQLLDADPEGDHLRIACTLTPQPALDWRLDYEVLPWIEIHHP